MIVGLYAGEAIAGGDACYVKAADNMVYLGLGDDETTALIAGFAAMPASMGEAVTLLHGVMFGYGPKVSSTDMAGGKPLYLSGTVDGGLADAASAAGTAPIAFTTGDGRIYALGNWAAGTLPTTVT